LFGLVASLVSLNGWSAGEKPGWFTALLSRAAQSDSVEGEKARQMLLQTPGWEEKLLLVAASPNPRERALAAQMLYLSKRAGAVDQLILLMADPDKDVRKKALGKAALWKDSSQRSRFEDVLLERLSREDDSGIRVLILDLLARFGSSRALPQFIKGLREPNELAREISIHALGNLLDERPVSNDVISALRNTAENGHPNDRIVAFYYLTRFPDGSGRLLLEKIAGNDPDATIKEAANAALK